MATREDVQSILGDLDDLVIERVLATGATSEEIAEALASLDDAQRSGDQPHLPTSGTVVEVRAILQELAADDQEDGVIYERDLHP
jgi:hypothetical protein